MTSWLLEIPFGSSSSSKTIFRIFENRFKFVRIKRQPFWTEVPCRPFPVLKVRSKTEEKRISAKLRCATEMGYNWNYQFAGQMQLFIGKDLPSCAGSWRGGDQGWINRRWVQEELAPRIQNGGLTTQHNMEKCRESFIIWPIFDWN